MLSELIQSSHVQTELPITDQAFSLEQLELQAVGVSSFEEPSEEELITMMDLIPLMPASDGWDQDLPTQVLPMSLDNFMDCFWADEAPFFLPGHLTGPEDKVVNYTNWLDPSADDQLLFGPKVIASRLIEKDLEDALYTKMWSTINTV